MNNYEKLAVLTAMEKAVKDAIREVRTEANADLLDAYDEMGVEKLALKLDGQKVGDFIVTFNAEGFEITDQEAFEEFALDYGLATTKRTIPARTMSVAINALARIVPPSDLDDYLETEVVLDRYWERALTNSAGVVTYLDSGMPVPGVAVRPRTVKGTMVRECKPEKVLPIAAGLKDGGINALLLEGGEA